MNLDWFDFVSISKSLTLGRIRYIMLNIMGVQESGNLFALLRNRTQCITSCALATPIVVSAEQFTAYRTR